MSMALFSKDCLLLPLSESSSSSFYRLDTSFMGERHASEPFFCLRVRVFLEEPQSALSPLQLSLPPRSLGSPNWFFREWKQRRSSKTTNLQHSLSVPKSWPAALIDERQLPPQTCARTTPFAVEEEQQHPPLLIFYY